MVLRRVSLAVFLLIAPAVWAQFGKADMTKLATQRIHTIAKALKLSPEEVSAIKPLLESKYTEIRAVKEKYMNSDKSYASKKEATEELASIDYKYDGQITSSLKPDQAEKYRDLSKGWKNDLSLNTLRW